MELEPRVVGHGATGARRRPAGPKPVPDDPNDTGRHPGLGVALGDAGVQFRLDQRAARAQPQGCLSQLQSRAAQEDARQSASHHTAVAKTQELLKLCQGL